MRGGGRGPGKGPEAGKGWERRKTEAGLQRVTEEATGPGGEDCGFLRPPLTGLFKGPANGKCAINSAGCRNVASQGAQETCVQQALQQWQGRAVSLGRARAGSSVSSNAGGNRKLCLASVTQHPWGPSGGVEWAVAWNAWS